MILWELIPRPPRFSRAMQSISASGLYMISIKANCIDSTLDAATVFADEVAKMKKDKLKPQEQLTLEPFERDHAVVVGVYRKAKKEGDGDEKKRKRDA